nr:MBL fold metallo-hydrolase [Clostridia bacterium]
PEQLLKADKQLAVIGYLDKKSGDPEIILIEFMLKDEPGGVTAVLELIEQFSFNISYISSQENGSDYQFFKMGLLVEDRQKIDEFLKIAGKLCSVRVIEYNHTEKIYDNSIFYDSFVSSLIEAGGISGSARNELLINTNLAMQILDENGMSPYRTFDSISKFADMLASSKGEAFSPRITSHRITDKTVIEVIEPPCGSNTMIIKSGGDYLFVDTGYAYYTKEMLDVIRQLIPEWDGIPKKALLTHVDVDHCGLLPLFDEVYMSRESAESIIAEHNGEADYREQNPMHKPYVRICKTLTEHRSLDPAKIRTPWTCEAPESGALWQIGYFSFGDLNFEVYEGRGGHVKGEIVLIDYEHRITFTGDIYINLKDMTPEQKRYNQYAPILMTTVDTDIQISRAERNAVLGRLGAGKWMIFGSHGAMKEYETVVNG